MSMLVNPYAASGGGTITDPFFSSVVQLAHFDGANNDTPPFTNSASAGVRQLGEGGGGENVGATVLSTAQTKFGATSVYFDGSSRVATQTSADYQYGTGDFTEEFWIRPDSNQTKNILAHGTGAGLAFLIYIISDGSIYYYQNATNRISGAAGSIVAASAFQHVAICRASGTSRLFVGGTQVGSNFSDTIDYNTTFPLILGASTGGAAPYIGYVDDLRVTKGVARYTSNFTVPVAAFPDS